MHSNDNSLLNVGCLQHRLCIAMVLVYHDCNIVQLGGVAEQNPVAMIGLVAFRVPWNLENLASILVGLVAGIIYVQAKSAPVVKY